MEVPWPLSSSLLFGGATLVGVSHHANPPNPKGDHHHEEPSCEIVALFPLIFQLVNISLLCYLLLITTYLTYLLFPLMPPPHIIAPARQKGIWEPRIPTNLFPKKLHSSTTQTSISLKSFNLIPLVFSLIASRCFPSSSAVP